MISKIELCRRNANCLGRQSLASYSLAFNNEPAAMGPVVTVRFWFRTDVLVLDLSLLIERTMSKVMIKNRLAIITNCRSI